MKLPDPPKPPDVDINELVEKHALDVVRAMDKRVSMLAPGDALTISKTDVDQTVTIGGSAFKKRIGEAIAGEGLPWAGSLAIIEALSKRYHDAGFLVTAGTEHMRVAVLILGGE